MLRLARKSRGGRRACISSAAALWMQGDGPYKHIKETKDFLEVLAFDANTSVKMLLERYLTISIAEKLNQDPRLYDDATKSIEDHENAEENVASKSESSDGQSLSDSDDGSNSLSSGSVGPSRSASKSVHMANTPSESDDDLYDFSEDEH